MIGHKNQTVSDIEKNYRKLPLRSVAKPYFYVTHSPEDGTPIFNNRYFKRRASPDSYEVAAQYEAGVKKLKSLALDPVTRFQTSVKKSKESRHKPQLFEEGRIYRFRFRSSFINNVRFYQHVSIWTSISNVSFNHFAA